MVHIPYERFYEGSFGYGDQDTNPDITVGNAFIQCLIMAKRTRDVFRLKDDPKKIS